jgi:hypothetical protein
MSHFFDEILQIVDDITFIVRNSNSHISTHLPSMDLMFLHYTGHIALLWPIKADLQVALYMRSNSYDLLHNLT